MNGYLFNAVESALCNYEIFAVRFVNGGHKFSIRVKRQACNSWILFFKRRLGVAVYGCKYKINFIKKVVDGELDEVAAYGEPVWAYQKRPELAYGYYTFDKYMRRVPCWWTDVEGEFATETEWENLVPISEVAQEYINPREGKLVPTDTKNYDYLFEIPEAPIESEKPVETVNPNEPVTPPAAYVCPFAENTAKIKELAEQIIKLCGG